MSIINPNEIIERGIISLPKSVDKEKIIQPNGIDLYVSSVSLIKKSFFDKVILIGDTVATNHSRTKPLKQTQLRLEDDSTFTGYSLKKDNQYKIETEYKLNLPEDVAAYIFTRSSFNRNGILVGSGLWDSGYRGPIGTTLYCFNSCFLATPCRIAQIVFFKADTTHLYNGAYNEVL